MRVKGDAIFQAPPCLKGGDRRQSNTMKFTPQTWSIGRLMRRIRSHASHFGPARLKPALPATLRALRGRFTSRREKIGPLPGLSPWPWGRSSGPAVGDAGPWNGPNSPSPAEIAPFVTAPVADGSTALSPLVGMMVPVRDAVLKTKGAGL